MIETTDGKRWLYRCEICGGELVYAKRKEKLPACGHECRSLAAWATCSHRGPVLTTINGRVAGCGCGSTKIEVYRCEHYREPVIKYGRPPCLDTLREQVSGATGRTCRECIVPGCGS